MSHALIFSVRSNYWERSSGAHRIATYLRQHGLDIEVVDFTPFWDQELLREFVKKSVKSDTIFFGFSIFFSYWNDTMTEFTTWLKEEYPHIRTIAGGQNILTAELHGIDIWMDSYGERAMLALAQSLANNNTNGIVFSPEYFGQKKVIKALHTYPSYNLEDYSILMEKRDYVEDWEWLTLEFSRGCKFACTFCNFPVLGVKEDTSRTQESFEYEVKYNYDNFGVNRYTVADETFNDRLEKITKFADVVDRLDFDTFYAGFIRADLLQNEGMIEELARMKFGGQYYGIETFNHDAGKMIGKGLHPDKVKSLLLKTKKYFNDNSKIYRGTISLIVGLPYERKEYYTEYEKWLEENWLEEGIMPFPLAVEDLDSITKEQYTNVSKFSLNLSKYGLRSMGAEKIDRHYKEWGATFNWKGANYASIENLWEQDTMNIFEAREISRHLRDLQIYKYKLSTYELPWVDIAWFDKEKDLQKAINVRSIDRYPDYDHMKKFIDRYSQRKYNG